MTYCETIFALIGLMAHDEEAAMMKSNGDHVDGINENWINMWRNGKCDLSKQQSCILIFLHSWNYKNTYEINICMI